MGMFVMLLLAAPPTTGGAPQAILAGAEGFDLAREPKPARCGDRTGGEILVCGRRRNGEIVVANPASFVAKPLKAEVGLPGGASVDVHGEQHSLPDGKSGPAAMVRVRIPF